MVIIFATDKQKYFIYEFGNLVKNVIVLLFCFKNILDNLRKKLMFENIVLIIFIHFCSIL